MATLEELIYYRLTGWPELIDKLAAFDSTRAVFYHNAPSDMAAGWKDKSQYPRLDYTVDMQANAERQSSGQLVINIWSNETGLPPENIEPSVRAALCGVFMSPDSDEDPPFCLSWRSSDSFEATNSENERGKLVIGITMLFDVYAFPEQVTSDPDPIMAINHFVKNLDPAVTVIGHDALTPYYEPQEETPALYFRLASLETSTETNTVAWMNGVIAGHVFAPTVQARLRWIRYLADTLALSGEIIMLDTSPMIIRKLTVDSGLDPLAQGQLRLQIRFGILRRAYVAPLMNINFQDEDADRNPKHHYLSTPVSIEVQPEGTPNEFTSNAGQTITGTKPERSYKGGVDFTTVTENSNSAGFSFNSKLAGKNKLP